MRFFSGLLYAFGVLVIGCILSVVLLYSLQAAGKHLPRPHMPVVEETTVAPVPVPAHDDDDYDPVYDLPLMVVTTF